MAFSKESAFERLSLANREGRLAHAYLLTGPAGSGKAWLATRLAALTLGCSPREVAGHADAHFVQPESKSRRIVTDQIRELDHALHRKPLLGRTKVAVIHEADRMQPQAANAFLKTLEEPPPGSLILLLSALPEAMLETILSRCIETALQGGETAALPERNFLLQALEECMVRPEKPGVSEAFRFTRTVQGILTGVRERVAEEFEQSLKEETARYKQTSDSGAYLSERAEQIKALTEAAALRERDRVLQIVVDALSNALRLQHGQPETEPAVRAIAGKFPPPNLLRRLDSLEKLRRRLALGVQETIALESGFLEMILTGD